MDDPDEIARSYDERLKELSDKRESLNQQMGDIHKKRFMSARTKSNKMWELHGQRRELLDEIERVHNGKLVRVEEAKEALERQPVAAAQRCQDDAKTKDIVQRSPQTSEEIRREIDRDIAQDPDIWKPELTPEQQKIRDEYLKQQEQQRDKERAR